MKKNESQLIDPSDQHVLPSSALSTREDLMPPPVSKPRKKQRVVLSEEEYLDALGSIIERDYYPDNAVMRRQLRMLDTLQEGGGGDRTARIRLTDIRNVQHGNITPLAVRDQEEYSPDGERYIDLTVNEFFSRFTSEDNDSFEKIREKDIADFKKKFHWVFEPSSADKASGYLMLYHMGGKELTSTERQKMDKLLEGRRVIGDERPNQVNTWRFKVRNSLLFPPELESHCSTSDIGTGYSAPVSDASERLRITDGSDMSAAVSALPRRALNSIADSGNTRVGSAVQAEKSILKANTRIDGVFSYRAWINNPSPLEYPHTPTTVSSEADSWLGGWDGPRSSSRQYHPVAMTPSLFPGEDPEIDNTLITWGTVFGTPLAIEDPILDCKGSITAAPVDPVQNQSIGTSDEAEELSTRFQIQVSQREKLLRELDKKARRRIETSAQGRLSSPMIQSVDKSGKATSYSRRPVPMSPAATALAERLRGASSSALGNFAPGLRESYTRTTPHKRSVHRIDVSHDKSLSKPSLKSTGLGDGGNPLIGDDDSNVNSVTDESWSLTDGLLKL